MSRAYTVAVTALIVGVDAKWLDNLLSRHQLPGVNKRRQGVQRSITEIGLLAIESCRVLNLELGVSLSRAAAITMAALDAKEPEVLRVETESGLVITWSLVAARQRLRARIPDAVEQVPMLARGRPPGRRE